MAEGEGTGGAGATGGDDKKTYSQEDYDKIVAERDALTKEKGDFEQSHKTLQDLYTNDRFREFIDDEDRRLALGEEEYNRIYGGGKPDKEGGGDEGGDFDKMSEEEKFAALNDRAEKAEAELKSLREEAAQNKYTKAKEDMKSEMNRLMTDEKTYPLFNKTITRDNEEVPVRELMKAELSRAAERDQDMTLDQAYRIVTYDAQRDLGRADAEAALEEKREAAKLGVPVTAPGRKTGDASKRYGTAREAAEAVMEDLGL